MRSLQKIWLHFAQNFWTTLKMTAMENSFSAKHVTAEFQVKSSAREQGVLTDGGKDDGTNNWIVISSQNDLFRLDVDVDFAKLNCKP